MRAEMKSQGVANICDENYIEPTDAEELAIDRLRQDFMYAVFNQVLKTSAGMQLVTENKKEDTKVTII